MEYNILLNSQVINEWADTGAIDPVNAILLSLLAKYDNPHNKLEHDSEGYVWLNLSYLLEQVPWLGITEATLGKRLKKMADSGIIDRKQRKIQSGSKLYFKMSETYRQMEVWYDELHTLESSGNIKEIEKHYLEKPIIKDEKECAEVSHPSQNVGAHPSQNTVPHPSPNASDPYTINPYTKRESIESISSLEEGATDKDSPPDDIPGDAKRLIARIENKIENDGKGVYYLTPEISKALVRGVKRYGLRWVAEQVKEFLDFKTPSQLRQYMHEDFPVWFRKAEKNKSPPQAGYVSRRKCPVCGDVVTGTMGSCGKCGFDVEDFEDPSAVEEHRKWFDSRMTGEIDEPGLSKLFEKNINSGKIAG